MFSRAERVEHVEAFWTGFTGSTGFEFCGAKAGQTTAQVADDGIHEKERRAERARQDKRELEERPDASGHPDPPCAGEPDTPRTAPDKIATRLRLSARIRKPLTPDGRIAHPPEVALPLFDRGKPIKCKPKHGTPYFYDRIRHARAASVADKAVIHLDEIAEHHAATGI